MLIFSSFYYIITLVVYAGVMELADVMDSKSVVPIFSGSRLICYKPVWFLIS